VNFSIYGNYRLKKKWNQKQQKWIKKSRNSRNSRNRSKDLSIFSNFQKEKNFFFFFFFFFFFDYKIKIFFCLKKQGY